MFSLAVALYFLLNMSSSVLIIVVNKYVFSIYNFNYPTVVTFVHFVFTAYVWRGGVAV